MARDQRVEDGNDIEAIEAAINEARDDHRPSLIAVRTHIGYGSPHKQDSQKAHGSPLGPDEVRLTKEAYGSDPDRTFYVPADALSLVPPSGDRRRAPLRGSGTTSWHATRTATSTWPRSSCDGWIDG